MRSGLFRRGMLGALIGALAASFKGDQGVTSPGGELNPEIPKSNRVGGGHHGSKPRRDSTVRIRARKRWLKIRRRESRRGVYTVQGPRL